MPEKVCPVCGTSFHIPNAWARKTQTTENCCSRECAAEHRRVHPKKPPSTGEVVTCICGCGETFTRPHDRPGREHKKGHGRKPHAYTPRPHKQAILVEMTCDNCGKVWRCPKGRKQGKNIFCCFKCAIEWRYKQPKDRVNVICSGCGKEIAVFPSKLKTNKKFYCSVQCRKQHIIGPNNPSYVHGRGRHVHYGLNWKSQRAAAMKRDSHRCQVCKRKPKSSHLLHVHHVTPAYKFTNYLERNALPNLLTLCHICHKLAERGKITLQRKLL